MTDGLSSDRVDLSSARMSETLRIGIVGAGGNTVGKHIPGFQKLDRVRVVTVANRSLESGSRVAEKCGIARVAGDWREVVEDPEVDAVCIGTWPNMHAEVTMAALQAGKHVLVEARMAMDLKEAQSMLTASGASPQLVAQIVPAPFTLPYDELIQQYLRNGRIGQLREVRVLHTTGNAASPKAPATWRQDVRLSGMNIMAMGIHYETVQRWLGPLDPQWLLAEAAIHTQRRSYPDGEEIEIEIPETISILGAYHNGTRLNLHLSSVESGKPAMEIRLNGNEGALRFDGLERKLYYSKAGSTGETILPAEGKDWQVEADFVDSIRRGTPVRLTSFADGVRYMRFTQCVDESWRTGNRVFMRPVH